MFIHDFALKISQSSVTNFVFAFNEYHFPAVFVIFTFQVAGF
ncbi:MAG: hypothetical protein ACOZBL_02530 [Patescibacteria group bacterium]